MNRRPLFLLLGTFGMLFCSQACSNEEKVNNARQPDSKPNIILIYADDLGWTDLGVQGSDYYESPTIDKLAEDGIRFTQAYAGAANCAPSRACLISGLNTPRHGVYTVKNSDRGSSKNRKLIPTPNTTVLNPSLKTLPQMLKDDGYATCMAGKWHLSDDSVPYGFDVNFGGYSKGSPNSYFSPYNNPQLSDGEAGEHLPDRLSNEVVDWIDKQKDQPFFVYLPFYSVHTPLQAREDLKAKYDAKPDGTDHDNSKYAAMIDAMDQAVAKVLNKVEELGLTENTLVVFSSDNGPHGPTSYARPLRGTKGMFYEGGIRVPFIVKWPGVVPTGTINNTVISQLDIFPTIMDLLGKEPDFLLDGESILDHWKGMESDDERTLYWHFPAYLQMYNGDRGFNDSHDPPHWRSAPCGVIRKGDWKLIEYFEDGDLELYNLRTDPGERTDWSDISVDKRKELYEQLVSWRKSTNAPVPMELNPEYEGS